MTRLYLNKMKKGEFSRREDRSRFYSMYEREILKRLVLEWRIQMRGSGICFK